MHFFGLWTVSKCPRRPPCELDDAVREDAVGEDEEAAAEEEEEDDDDDDDDDDDEEDEEGC